MRRLETTSLPIPHPCRLSRRLAHHEHVDELHTEPARHDARDRPDVACARRRQVKPRAFGRPVVPTSPQPPPGAAIVAHAFVSSSAHAMSTPLTASQPDSETGRLRGRPLRQLQSSAGPATGHYLLLLIDGQPAGAVPWSAAPAARQQRSTKRRMVQAAPTRGVDLRLLATFIAPIRRCDSRVI